MPQSAAQFVYLKALSFMIASFIKFRTKLIATYCKAASAQFLVVFSDDFSELQANTCRHSGLEEDFG